MTDAVARQLLSDDLTWYATMMMQMGKSDGMVSGACHTTADTMRPALQVRITLVRIRFMRIKWIWNQIGHYQLCQ